MLVLAGTAATATFRDLRRRPGVLLAVLAAATLLILLPDLCTRAVEESPELSHQIAVATISLFAMVIAGFAGLRAGAADGDLGATVEWRAGPMPAGAYVLGRFVGIVALAATLVVVLAVFAFVGDVRALVDEPPQTRVALIAATGAVLCAAQFASVGLLLGTITTPQLAAVLLVATIVATRTLLPDAAGRGEAIAAIAAALPDPARLDLSRELAFHRPVDAASAALACVSSALQTTACLVAATWALARRES